VNVLGGMRWQGLALVVAVAAGGGSGCGGEPALEAVLCTATAGTAARSASRLDARGLPSAAWSWDARGALVQTTYAYDDAGRLTQQRVDRGSGMPNGMPNGMPDSAPDGIAEEELAIVYADGGATADVIATDQRTGSSDRIASYVFDEHGRPSRIDKVEGGAATEVYAYRYDDAGRLAAIDERIQRTSSPQEAHLAYTYGADGRPASLLEVRGGVAVSWRFQYEEAPGQVAVTRLREGSPSVATTCVYEHDAEGRLVRVLGGTTADRDLDIAYGDDGAVAILTGSGTLHTYSAACGVRLEGPRGPAAPREPEPTGHFAVPAVRSPF